MTSLSLLRGSLASLVFVLAGLGAAVTHAEEPPVNDMVATDELIRLAQDEYTAGQYAASYRYWVVLLERVRPVPVDWHFYAGDAAERADQCSDAERHFREALAYDALSDEIRQRLAQRIEAVQACIARNEERRRATFIREAEDAMRANQFERAAQLFADAAAIRSDASLPLHRARALELAGQLEASLQVLEATSVVQQGMNHDLYEARSSRIRAELRGEPLQPVRIVTVMEPRRGLRVAGWTLFSASAAATAAALPLAIAANADVEQGCAGNDVCLPSVDAAIVRRRRATTTTVAAGSLLATSVTMLIVDAATAGRRRTTEDAGTAVSWSGNAVRLRF